jgi:hypothetical protein
MMKKAIKAWEEDKFLSTFVPEPNYKKAKVLPTFPDIRGNNDPVDPDQAWWDWRVQNWGTKWELETKGTRNGHDTESIQACFDSAWSPPVEAYKTLTKLGFHIEAYFYEPVPKGTDCVQVKLDEEGVVIDAYTPKTDEPCASTWKTYQEMEDGE